MYNSVAYGKIKRKSIEKGRFEMTCIIDEKTTKIERKDGYWLVGGKLKVKDLSECQILPAKHDRTITIGTKTESTSQPTQSKPTIQVEAPMSDIVPKLSEATVGSTSDDIPMSAIKDFAGDSVWGAIAIMALIMLSKFLNKYFDLQSNRSKATEDISKQCDARQVGNDEKVQGLTKKLEDMQTSLSETERRIAGLELELKYIIDPPPPRNRQNKDYFDDEHPPQTRFDRQERPERLDRQERPERMRPPKN